MNKHTTDIVSYITWIGLIIAFVMGDRQASRFHINQSLVIWIVGTVSGLCGLIPLVGWVISLVGGILTLVCWILGLISAVQGTEKAVPILGGIKLL